MLKVLTAFAALDVDVSSGAVGNPAAFLVAVDVSEIRLDIHAIAPAGPVQAICPDIVFALAIASYFGGKVSAPEADDADIDQFLHTGRTASVGNVEVLWDAVLGRDHAEYDPRIA